MEKTGKFLKIPYDFRSLTWEKVKKRCWNPKDKRIFVPKAFGWGWSINFYPVRKLFSNGVCQVLRKLRIVK